MLLNGERINVTCDPNTTTAGQIFQVQTSLNFISTSIRKVYCKVSKVK
jgi:hypothetical protein